MLLMRRTSRSTTRIVLLLPTLLLAACGQSQTPDSAHSTGLQAGVVTAQPSALTTLNLQLFVPKAVKTEGVGPQFVSPGTDHVRIQVGNTDQTVYLSGKNCVYVDGGQLCTFDVTIDVEAGSNQTLIIGTYDAASHLLGTSSQPITITLGTANQVNLTLQGVAASGNIGADFDPARVFYTYDDVPSIYLDVGGSYGFSVAVNDASKANIIGSGRPAVTLTSDNPAFVVSGHDSTGYAYLGTSYHLQAPDPTTVDQTATLSLRDAGSGLLLAQRKVVVPAEQVQLTLSSNTVVAGGTIFADARLLSARGVQLNVYGRPATFTTTDGTFSGGGSANFLGGESTVSINVGTRSGAIGIVTASDGAVSAQASFTSVAGAPSVDGTVTTLRDQSAYVGDHTVLTVAVGDRYGNPVANVVPTVLAGNATVGRPSQNGNVYSYPVTVGDQPGFAQFTVSTGDDQHHIFLGSAFLEVLASPTTP